MAIQHFYSQTVADGTATSVVRPSDWNSNHKMVYNLSGNTLGSSQITGADVVLVGGSNITLSADTANSKLNIIGNTGLDFWSIQGNTLGTNVYSWTNDGLYLFGGNNVTLSGNGSTLTIAAAGGGAQTLSSFYNMMPASTASQTLGANNVTSASALFFPFILSANVQFNHMNVTDFMSVVTSATAAAGGQTISRSFGIYSNNAGTLSQISSGSFSLAGTFNSVSATVSLPTATSASGYGYNTIQATTTAQQHSFWGTVGSRDVELAFGNTMSLTPGVYWLGMMHRMSSSGFNVGLSYGLVGNVAPQFNNVAPIGVATTASTTNSAFRAPMAGFGAYTSTGSAGYGGTALPSSAFLSGIAMTGTVLPMIGLLST